MEIRCKKGDCKHNTGCSCRAKGVEITRGTVSCNSYVKDDLKENLIIRNGNIFDIVDELVPANTHNVPLQCRQRNCLYNKSEKCCANGITVIEGETPDGEEDAECATFIEG